MYNNKAKVPDDVSGTSIITQHIALLQLTLLPLRVFRNDVDWRMAR